MPDARPANVDADSGQSLQTAQTRSLLTFDPHHPRSPNRAATSSSSASPHPHAHKLISHNPRDLPIGDLDLPQSIVNLRADIRERNVPSDSLIQLYIPSYLSPALSRVRTMSVRAIETDPYYADDLSTSNSPIAALTKASQLPKGLTCQACIEHGIKRLWQSEEVREYLATARALDSTTEDAPELDHRVVTELSLYLLKWSFSIPMLSGSKPVKLSFRAPESHAAHLHGRADNLGMSRTALGTVALMIGMMGLPGTYPQDNDYFEKVESQLLVELGDRIKFVRQYLGSTLS